MTLVRFISVSGDDAVEVEAPAGANLLAVAQSCDQPLEAPCGGQMAGSPCHVIVDAGDFAKLPEASEAEEDLLDLASHVTRYSRLACQILIPEGLDRLTVRIPGGVHNMRGR